MQKPDSVAALTGLGRVRLSEHFFMREMLYSEVANFHCKSNFPEDPDLAIAAGEKLCQLVLEPLRRGFGHITVRSAYRSPSLNHFCSERYKAGDKACFCSDNEYNRARHIWDLRDADGFLGATASVVVPAYLDFYARTGDHKPLAWWICDNVPDYADLAFYPTQCAFNIRWYEGSSDKEIRRWTPDSNEVLTRRDMDNFAGDHRALYEDALRAILV
jgi:hypothetical protein